MEADESNACILMEKQVTDYMRIGVVIMLKRGDYEVLELELIMTYIWL